MAEKRLLYFTANRVVAVPLGARPARGRVVVREQRGGRERLRSASSAPRLAASSTCWSTSWRRISTRRTIPFVRGADRRTLRRPQARPALPRHQSLARDLARVREDAAARRAAAVQLVHEQRAVPALARTSLRETEAAVAGVYSVALLAPRLALEGRPEEGAGAARDAAAGRACARATSRAGRSASAAWDRSRRRMPRIRAGWPRRSIARRRASTST